MIKHKHSRKQKINYIELRVKLKTKGKKLPRVLDEFIKCKTKYALISAQIIHMEVLGCKAYEQNK